MLKSQTDKLQVEYILIINPLFSPTGLNLQPHAEELHNGSTNDKRPYTIN